MLDKAEKQAKKYSKKVDGKTLESQAKNYAIAAEKQAQTDAEVKQILAGRVRGFLQVTYMNFAKEIKRVLAHHSGEVACQEVNILYTKHKARGELEDALRDIIAYYVPMCAPPAITYFLLDQSLLDGPDVLA
jgi:hypothetical protein